MEEVKSQVSEIPEFDFDAHRRSATALYQTMRPLYEEFSLVIKNIIIEALKIPEITVHSIEYRAKSPDSFGKKAAIPSELEPNQPKYTDPLAQITDLAGVRIITFFPKTVDQVDEAIGPQFDILEKTDKADVLMKEEKLGYHSIHYIVKLKGNRVMLPEYNRFSPLVAEIQLRTILQHAWAEIDHDIQYKSVESIPMPIKRRFMALAGLLEIADREFQAIQDEDESLRQAARVSVSEGRLETVEITPDALKAYLDNKLGPDGRMTPFSYEWTARLLRKLGFSNLRQIDECIKNYDDDHVSRVFWGNRQGQLTRFEGLLLSGMGRHFMERHTFSNDGWFKSTCLHRLALCSSATPPIPVGDYCPNEDGLGDGDNPRPVDG